MPAPGDCEAGHMEEGCDSPEGCPEGKVLGLMTRHFAPISRTSACICRGTPWQNLAPIALQAGKTGPQLRPCPTLHGGHGQEADLEALEHVLGDGGLHGGEGLGAALEL